METMGRTVDDIPYLCSTIALGKHTGILSREYEQWLKEVREEYYKSDKALLFKEWLIDKFIPLDKRKFKTDIDFLTLPKVFRYDNLNIKMFQSGISQMRMDVSINLKEKIILVL